MSSMDCSASRAERARAPVFGVHRTEVGQFVTFDMGPQIVDNAAVFRCERTVGTRVCQATIGVEIDYVTYRFSQ